MKMSIPSTRKSKSEVGDQKSEVRGRRSEVGKSENRRSEEHTSELQSPCNLVCRLLLEKKKHLLLLLVYAVKFTSYDHCVADDGSDIRLDVDLSNTVYPRRWITDSTILPSQSVCSIACS